MPIVVRELIIRARVEETNTSGNKNTPASSSNGSGMHAGKLEEIVALCVEKVMEALERKKER